MADKTIGSLPAASALDDPSLLVVEQHGAAMKLTYSASVFSLINAIID